MAPVWPVAIWCAVGNPAKDLDLARAEAHAFVYRLARQLAMPEDWVGTVVALSRWSIKVEDGDVGMTWDQLLESARAMWGDGIEASPTNIHAAAAGMVSQWYRNTEAVEHFAHAAGPWADRDMVRHNAWVTELCRQALTAIADDLLTSPTPRLEALLEAIIEELPNARAKRSLRHDKGNAPHVATEWISINGFGNYIAFLASSCPTNWWGALDYGSVVDNYCALSTPPEPNFRSRMLASPWTLTDDQADFVCDYRYDV